MQNEIQEAVVVDPVAGSADSSVEASAHNPLERRLDISISVDEVDREVETRLQQTARTARMPGFRPGKVPMNIVRQNYGGEVRAEVLTAKVQQAFFEQAKATNLIVAGYPRIEPRAGTDAKSLEFSAIFETIPEVVIGDLSMRELVKPMLEINEAEVDKALEALRRQRSEFVTAARAAGEGDRVIIDFAGRRDGVEFDGGKGEDYPLVLGAKTMLADFEAALVGVVAGQGKTVTVNFPEDYPAKELAGQRAEFDIKVKEVQERRLPEIDAEFAKNLGVKNGDLNEMRNEVRGNLQREVKKRLHSRIKSQVMDALLEVTPLDAPRTLVEAEARQMAESARQDMVQRGYDIKDQPPVNLFRESAVRRVKLGLILAEVVKRQELHARPEQVRAVVDEFATAFEDPQEVVRWYYSQAERLSEAEALVMENNVVDWVLTQAKVTEKPVSFDELMTQTAA